jgi:uncharacterized protein YukE
MTDEQMAQLVEALDRLNATLRGFNLALGTMAQSLEAIGQQMADAAEKATKAPRPPAQGSVAALRSGAARAPKSATDQHPA